MLSASTNVATNAAVAKMHSVGKQHISNLSNEAYLFRWLVRKYVARKLHESSLSVPASLLAGLDAVWLGNLNDALIRVVD
jgi:hypothetical protein